MGRNEQALPVEEGAPVPPPTMRRVSYPPVGYEHVPNAPLLSCLRCAALVLNDPPTIDIHDNWHARVERQLAIGAAWLTQGS